MMEQLPENGHDDSPAATMPAASVGTMLREARERLGLSVADIANQTKLAPRQIEALEAEDFRHLPEMSFVRGFVRSYARILQLDAQPLLASLPQTDVGMVQVVPNSVEVPFPTAHSPQRQNLIWLGAALVLSVLLVAFAVWHFTTPPAKPETAQVETPVPLPATTQAISATLDTETVAAETVQAAKTTIPQAVPQSQLAKPTPQPDISQQTAILHLTFDKDSWTEIRDKDDKVLSSQINPPGSELRLKGQAPFSLVIGNAASVQLYHRGKQVDLTPYINSSSEVARLTLK